MKINDAFSALLSEWCSSEPMTEYVPLIGSSWYRQAIYGLSCRSYSLRDELTRPDNITLRKATLYSMLSYLELHTGYVPGVRNEIEKIKREIADLN